MAPGVVASEVARAAGIHVSQLFRWRQQLCSGGDEAGFARVAVATPGESMASALIEVEFARGTRLRIAGPVDAATVAAAITALGRSERRR